MENEIRALVSDLGRFAEMASKVKPNRIKYKIYDTSNRCIYTTIIDIERNGIETIEECFATAFIINLFYFEEWKDDSLEKDNISESEWKGYLEKVWFAQYLGDNENICLKSYETEKMIYELKEYIVYSGMTKEQAEEITKNYSTLNSLLVCDYYCSKIMFGADENRIIYCNYGVYD